MKIIVSKWTRPPAGQGAARDGFEVVLVHVEPEADEVGPAGGVRLVAAEQLDADDGGASGHLEVVGDDELESGLEHAVVHDHRRLLLCLDFFQQLKHVISQTLGMIVSITIDVPMDAEVFNGDVQGSDRWIRQ